MDSNLKIPRWPSITAVLLAAVAGTAHAATVSISNWTYGEGKKVVASGYTDAAGGLTARISNAGSDNAATVYTYALEKGKDLPFESASDYTVVDGGSYFQQQFNDTGVADRLARLMTVVATTPTLVDTAAESASLQLAVWNLVYDTDYSVSSGSFKDTSGYAKHANALLALVQTQTYNGFTLKVLQSNQKEDLFYAVPSLVAPNTPTNNVPEPGIVGLVGLGLFGIGATAWRARRRR